MNKNMQMTALLTVNIFYWFRMAVTIYALAFYFSWEALLTIYLGLVLYLNFGVSITFHRYLTHRTFEFRYKWMEYVGILLGTFGGVSDPLRWTIVHKNHHRYSDTPDDPHSPKYGGWWLCLHSIVTHTTQEEMYGVRRMITPLLSFLHYFYIPVVVAWWGVLYLIGDVWLMTFFGIIPSFFTTFLTYFLHAGVAHTLGYRTYDIRDDSKNVAWVWPIDWGESLHNNHHAKPHLYSFSHKWYEIDLLAWIIRNILSKKETT